MTIKIEHGDAEKGRAPSVQSRTTLLFIEDCPHRAQKKNFCKICITKSIQEAIRRALIQESYIPRESELQEE